MRAGRAREAGDRVVGDRRAVRAGDALKRTRATVWTLPVGLVVHVYQVSVCPSRAAAAPRVAGCTRSRNSTSCALVAARRWCGRAGEADQRVEERRAALLEQRGLADADEAAAVLDVRLQRGLPGGVEHVARRS